MHKYKTCVPTKITPSPLKMEAAYFSETVIRVYPGTLHYILRE